LNHTVATQESLEQKEFVLDEKEIEIMLLNNFDKRVEQLREKLATAEQLSASQESKNAELLATFEQETADIENWRAKLKCTGRSFYVNEKLYTGL
jgi:vacuolar-type H+-ATPase subunit I/STV1